MTANTLIVRLEGPLMSLGAPLTEQRGPSWAFPGRAMLTGLLGNALGVDHREHGRLQALQQALHYASRLDRPGQLVTDYQTADLGQPFMLAGWTTWGAIEKRAGGSSTGTQPRRRQYWADAVLTVAIQLRGASPPTTVEDAFQALRFPARPLFLGRKPCLPSAPLAVSVGHYRGLRDALERAPVHVRAAEPPWRALLPASEVGAAQDGAPRFVTDDRDWANQIHAGQRRLVECLVGQGA